MTKPDNLPVSSSMSRKYRRRARAWLRRQKRLEGRHPLSKSRLGEAGTCRGECIEVGCVEAEWTAPPRIHLDDGSTVRLFKDGQGLTAAMTAIATARSQICLETYIFHSDDTGRAFATALAAKAREGVRVFVIRDSFGSLQSDPAMFEMMRQAGVHLAEFHPLNPWDCTHSWRPLNRDHRKLLVIDNQAAGLGGLNIGLEYGSGFLTPRERKFDLWRDNSISVTGPGVAMFAECFARMWRYCHRGGPIVAAGYALPISDPASISQSRLRTNVHSDRSIAAPLTVLASVPTPKSPLIPFLRDLMRRARRSLDLTMAYFAPSDVLVGELIRARERGVRVRLMFPGRSDVKVVRAAAHSFYEPLLIAGVEIWERQGAILHAKSLVIDDEISVLGSTNLDYRSIEFNCELSAVIRSRPFAMQMGALFRHDTNYSERIHLENWRQRPWRDRIVQWAASRARYLL
jgi:cardiolipin synthase